MNVLIRAARESDLPAILEINNHEILHSTVNYDFDPKTLDWQLDWFNQKNKAGFPVLFVPSQGIDSQWSTPYIFRSELEEKVSESF